MKLAKEPAPESTQTKQEFDKTAKSNPVVAGHGGILPNFKIPKKQPMIKLIEPHAMPRMDQKTDDVSSILILL